MDKVGTHAAAIAKAKAIMGRLLTDHHYKELLKLETFQEVIDYLRNQTHYRTVLEFAEGESLDQIEVRIEKYFFSTYEKFYHYYVDNYRDFFKALLFRYEVENLKLYLRLLARDDKIENLETHLIFSSLYSNLDYAELSKATTITEFIEGLKETLYYNPLKQFIEDDSSLMVFHMEMVLDKLYFDRLYLSITKLGKYDREIMLELLGINIDILNIQWLYRGRRFFDISSEELFNFTLLHGRRYDEKAIKMLCYLPLDEFRTLISGGDYKDIFSDKEYMMERAMERHLYYALNDYTKKATFSIAVPVVLLFKFEYEIRDLFTILEGIHYRSEDVKDLLIREIER